MIQDGNGYIDRRELALMMRFIGEPVTQEEIDVSRPHRHCYCYHYFNCYCYCYWGDGHTGGN